jgi:signal transduction histidine kinase
VFLNESKLSLRVQNSSTKILRFLVNDILDFSQIKGGKFRQNLTNFDVREAVEEIMLI